MNVFLHTKKHTHTYMQTHPYTHIHTYMSTMKQVYMHINMPLDLHMYKYHIETLIDKYERWTPHKHVYKWDYMRANQNSINLDGS